MFMCARLYSFRNACSMKLKLFKIGDRKIKLIALQMGLGVRVIVLKNTDELKQAIKSYVYSPFNFFKFTFSTIF